MMLVGAPDSGKSHLMVQTLSKIGPLEDNDIDECRLIACPVPSPATFKSMTLALLEDSGFEDVNFRQ